MSATVSPPTGHRMLLDTRGHRRLHGWLTVACVTAVGGAITAVAAGVAIRYLMKGGVSGTSLLGLVTLVAGLALLTFGWRIAWSRTRRWQRLWFVPIVLTLLLAMFCIAQGTMLAWSPRNGLGSATPADRGLSYTDVTFGTSDGTRHGYSVLLLDPRGQGRSGGHAMDAGWYGDRDLAAAVGFVQQQPGVDPNRIGVRGLSMGGEEAIGAAAAVPAIHAVVAEGATHRTAADKAGYLPGGLAGAIQRGLDLLTYGTAAFLSSAPKPGTLHDAIAQATDTRFLLIAADKAVDEADAAAYLRTAAPARVQTWTVAGATHTHGLATAPDEWTARVTEFLDRALELPSH